MKKTSRHLHRLRLLLSVLLVALQQTSWANSIVWSCSRSEPKQAVFDGIKAFRIENLTTKDTDTISITLLDLYGAYGGEIIQMGKSQLSVCSLPPKDPLQTDAMTLLGYTSEDLIKASKTPATPLIFIPSIHQMQKCLNENHPAVGFFQHVVENERIGPCF